MIAAALTETAGNGRRLTRRGAAGLLLAGLILCRGAREGAAEPKKTTTAETQNEFVQGCRERGGTPKRERKRVVSCTNGNYKRTCNFNKKPAECTTARLVPVTPKAGGGAATPGGGVGGGPVADPDPDAGGANPGGGATAPDGGVAEQ
jgi:hypothetical protein